MNALSLRDRLVKSIKWFVLFVVAMAYFKPRAGEPAPSIMLVILVCIPVYIAIYRVVYESVEELYEGVGYIFTPDLLSLAFGELRQDIMKSTKLIIWIALCVLCVTRLEAYYDRMFALVSQV